ncbi:endonuclease/exonuclease/phosphatase family protein [Actinocorallia longicatena]|uniref:endonuclease/exonuclease/phosphatase family protein n=1 Tax=Actinocorallia longicatena TaxID=111803 RepID=UPI0031CF94BB
MSIEAVTEPLRERRLVRGLVWGATALWGAWALGRLTGADRIPFLDALTIPLVSLTPYMAAFSPVPVAAALVSRNRRAALTAGAVVIAFGFAVLPRAIADDQPPAHGPALKVMSANLMFGRASYPEVVELVRAERVDVLSVQEFTPDARNGLAEAGLHALLPYEVVDARWGAEGSGVYSRHPLTALPPLPGTVMALPRASLTLDGRTVEITAVHPLPPINGPQRADWDHVLRTLPRPSKGVTSILAGDFNATLDHARLRSLLHSGYRDAADTRGKGLTPSWGVTMFGPPLTLDHILVPENVAVRSYRVTPLEGTDHRPVITALTLP